MMRVTTTSSPFRCSARGKFGSFWGPLVSSLPLSAPSSACVRKQRAARPARAPHGARARRCHRFAIVGARLVGGEHDHRELDQFTRRASRSTRTPDRRSPLMGLSRCIERRRRPRSEGAPNLFARCVRPRQCPQITRGSRCPSAAKALTPRRRRLRTKGQRCAISSTAAVLASPVGDFPGSSADHDQQIWRRPNVRYGEAVGIHPVQPRRAATPGQSRFADPRNRLFGQLEWPYGGSDDRSGSENLRQ